MSGSSSSLSIRGLAKLLEEGDLLDCPRLAGRLPLARVCVCERLLRVLEAEKFANKAIVKTATKADTAALKSQIDTALNGLGVKMNTPVQNVVDETLVGGFVATFDYKEYNQSYKKALKSLFESITS